jgi:hypothetical protein
MSRSIRTIAPEKLSKKEQDLASNLARSCSFYRVPCLIHSIPLEMEEKKSETKEEDLT